MQPRLYELLQAYFRGDISADDLAELYRLIGSGEHKEQVTDYLSQEWQSLTERDFRALSEPREQEMLKAILNASAATRPVHRVHFLKTSWFRYAAAIIILSGIGAYLWNTQQKEKPQITQTSPVPVNDISPGKNRAILTLSDGKKVELNNATSETINDGAIPIKNSNGQLLYSHSERGSLSSAGGGGASGAGGGPRESRTAGYNTMSTPPGGQYQLTLSDGTRVWLNAASSITYPTIFNGKKREVSVTGEAYFEVTPDKSKPFTVQSGDMAISVLGTSFNINTYSDEPVKNLTLLEGAVSVKKGNISKQLKPGQQAQVSNQVTIADAVNIEEVMAWKNGRFQFSGAGIETIMKQVARWYDAEVFYEGKIKGNFVAEISRDVPVSKLLQILELTGRVHFEVKGKKIIVKP